MRCLVSIAILSLVMVSPAVAAGHPQDGNRDHRANAQAPRPRAGDWLAKHLNLSPSEQQRALESDPEFRNLNSQQQEKEQNARCRFTQ